MAQFFHDPFEITTKETVRHQLWDFFGDILPPIFLLKEMLEFLQKI